MTPGRGRRSVDSDSATTRSPTSKAIATPIVRAIRAQPPSVICHNGRAQFHRPTLALDAPAPDLRRVLAWRSEGLLLQPDGDLVPAAGRREAATNRPPGCTPFRFGLRKQEPTSRSRS
jgi:hypothetical protein